VSDKTTAVAKTKGEAFVRALTQMEPQLQSALPAHVPLERFKRVVVMAVQKAPDLLDADQRSLFLACQRAAADGLLPDGREGAIVLFGKQAQWMPMVAGLMKLARNSGEIASINAHVAYKGEKFCVVLGDDEKIEHERNLELADGAEPIGVYAIAKLRNGEVVREVLTKAQVEKIRNVSRAKGNGPWVTWWEEMARKTAIRRLAKRLPLATDRDADARLVSAAERHDVIDAEVEEAPAESAARPKVAGKLDLIEGSIDGDYFDEEGSAAEPEPADAA
jgi:recombination protein RecT